MCWLSGWWWRWWVSTAAVSHTSSWHCLAPGVLFRLFPYNGSTQHNRLDCILLSKNICIARIHLFVYLGWWLLSEPFFILARAVFYILLVSFRRQFLFCGRIALQEHILHSCTLLLLFIMWPPKTLERITFFFILFCVNKRGENGEGETSIYGHDNKTFKWQHLSSSRTLVFLSQKIHEDGKKDNDQECLDDHFPPTTYIRGASSVTEMESKKR